MLLRVQDTPERNRAAREFSRRVFGFAGIEILPDLHAALTSDDRVIRSNAARGCGSVGDRSSIPHLVNALDLESGLSRASIVWALGELKAKQSIPHLVTLYIDARNDEKQRRGAGFRSAQSVAVYQSHFDTLRNLQSIGRDWSRLKQSLRAQPVDPRRNEELLSPRIILTAVSQIGSASAQQFYRRLAADGEYEPRLEAAERLAEGGSLDKPRNVPILRNLLADQWPDVRMRAAVSLLILGETFSQPQILAWLKSPNVSDRWNMFMQLKRIKDGKQLTFAKEAIARAPLPDNPYPRKLVGDRQAWGCVSDHSQRKICCILATSSCQSRQCGRNATYGMTVPLMTSVRIRIDPGE